MLVQVAAVAFIVAVDVVDAEDEDIIAAVVAAPAGAVLIAAVVITADILGIGV